MECNNQTFSKSNGRLPILAIFICTNLFIYSSIHHKEPRFIGCIYPLAGLYFATTLICLVQLERNVSHYLQKSNSIFRLNASPVKCLLKLALLFFCASELWAINCRGNYGHLLMQDIEVYNFNDGRSDKILRYDREKYPDADFEEFPDISSVCVTKKYFDPVHTYAHIKGKDKITVTYSSFYQPTHVQS